MAQHARIKIHKRPPSLTSQQEAEEGARVNKTEAKCRKFIILRKLTPAATETKHGHHWTSLSKGPPNLIEQLGSISKLQNTNYILIKKAGNHFTQKFMKMNCAYDLVNAEGNRILYACETLYDSKVPELDDSKCFKRRPSFDITVIGAQCDNSFNITCDHRTTSVSTGFEYIGQIVSTTFISCRCFKPSSYKVQDCYGNTTHYVKYLQKSSVIGFPPNYCIVDKNTSVTVCKITCDWNSGEFPDDTIWSDYYGIKFSNNLPFKLRLLFIGAFFTIIGTQGFYSVNRVLKDLAYIEWEEVQSQKHKGDTKGS